GQRGEDDRGPDARVQQAAPGTDHAGAPRDRRRAGAVSGDAARDVGTGTIVQVVGPVVDVEFPDALPPIYTALAVDCFVQDEPVHLTLEVQQHLGDRRVRAISMSATEGLKRGYRVRDSGGPISMPVGEG